MASSFIPSNSPRKGEFKNPLLSLKTCYLEPLWYAMGGWKVLDLSSILFIKPEIHCKHFAPFEYCVLQTNLYQTRVQDPVLCLKRLNARLL